MRQKLLFCSKKRIYEPAAGGKAHRSVYLRLDTHKITTGCPGKLFKCFGLAALTESLDNLQTSQRTLVRRAILAQPSPLTRCPWEFGTSQNYSSTTAQLC